MPTLILGIGSPFADDQAGWLVADWLLAMPELKSRLNSGQLVIESTDRPGLNLLIWLQKGYAQIILIDMVKTNLATAGNIYHLQAAEIMGFSGMLSSHNLGVAPSLALAQALGMDLASISFWGIEGLNHKPGLEMSPAIVAAIPQLASQIYADLS